MPNTRWIRWRNATATLKFQIAALAVGVAIGVAWLTAWVVMHVDERQAISLVLKSDAAAVQRTATLVSSKVDVLRSTLAHAADAMPVSRIDDPAAMQAFLSGMTPLQALFDHLFVTGADGEPQAMMGLRDRDNPRVPMALREHAHEVLRSAQPQVSRPYLMGQDEEPLVVIGLPVFQGHVVAGVIGGALSLRSWRLLSLDNDPDDTHAVRTLVLDHDDTVILHPDDARLLGRADDEPGLSRVMAHWRRLGPALGAAPTAVHADRQLVSMAVVPSTGWKVVRIVPEGLAFASLAAAQRSAWLLGLGLALAAGMVAAAMAIRLTRPIAELERRAAQLLDDAQTPADEAWPRAHGELGRLTDTLRRVVAERRERQRETQFMHERLLAILEHAPMGIAFARSSRFELVSRHLAQMFGRDTSELQGHSTRIMYASDADRSDLVARAKSMFATSGSFDGEARLAQADGNVFWGRLRARAVRHGDVSAGTIWIVEDVTHAREQRQQLSWAADHDALTGLANRAAFDRQLVRAIDEDQSFCALFMDLDRFKHVNDNAGHAAGDRVLRDVAALIGTLLRQTDLVARLGGDEFGALLLNCPPDRAVAVGEAIRRGVEAYRLDWNSVVFSIGISIGVVHRDDALDSVAKLMNAADAACYAAKRGGRNRVVMYTPGLMVAQAAQAA